MAEPEEKTECLLMTGAQRGPPGHRASVSIDSNDNVAVMVYDNLVDRKLLCTVGIVNKTSNKTAWGAAKEYDTGKQPSVALIHVYHDLYALEVHRSQVLKSCFYRIGKVNKQEKEIDWSIVPAAVKLDQCSGVKPKICAACNGTVVIVHETSYSVKSLQYHIGKLDEQTRRIEGLSTCLKVPHFPGVEPDVAISDNKLVLVCRSDFSTLQALVGVVNANNAIEWGRSCRLSYGGINPSISINAYRYIVESHQTKALRQVCRIYGRIDDNNAITWTDSSFTSATSGEYPAISLADDGYVIAAHKTNFGMNLFRSQGQLINAKTYI